MYVNKNKNNLKWMLEGKSTNMKHVHNIPPGEKIQVLTTSLPYSQMEPLSLQLEGATERKPGK